MVKTIVEKLNLNKFDKKLLLNCPDENYISDLESFEQVDNNQSYDLIFVFVSSAEAFTHPKIKADGNLVLAYPKKRNKKFASYIHRDELFGLLGLGTAHETGIVPNTSLKFNRMVGLDEIYTVVTFKNIENQKQKKTLANSQKSADYQKKVPELEKLLPDKSPAHSFFKALTPGYQKDWARYIFSAKQETTQEKRKTAFRAAMEKEIKTADLYNKQATKRD